MSNEVTASWENLMRQGSQWERVMLINEAHVFESHAAGRGDRWLYTALTRARVGLTVVSMAMRQKRIRSAA